MRAYFFVNDNPATSYRERTFVAEARGNELSSMLLELAKLPAVASHIRAAKHTCVIEIVHD